MYFAFFLSNSAEYIKIFVTLGNMSFNAIFMYKIKIGKYYKFVISYRQFESDLRLELLSWGTEVCLAFAGESHKTMS